MLEKIAKIIARFFGIIAGSLSGISAVLIAIGYLAERGHLKMLGFTTIPVDLDQYLYTGANLIGFLPGIIILQSISLLLEPIALLLLGIGILAWFSMRIQKMKLFWEKTATTIQNLITRFKIALLVLLVLFQILSLGWMVRAILAENLLFSNEPIATEQEFTFFNANTDSIKQLLISNDEEDKDNLSRYFTQLFLITLLIGLTIRFLMNSGKKDLSQMSFHMKFWFGINYLLFATQIILLPGNYGVLLLDNKYQEVKVQFTANPEQPASDNKSPNQNNLRDGAIVASESNNLVSEDKGTIPNQLLELEGLPFRFDLEASPKLFIGISDENLSYAAESGNPEILKIEIIKNILTVKPLKTGKTSVTIHAIDTNGNTESTSFNVSVEDRIIPLVMEKENSIPQKTMVAGDAPFVRQLLAEPTLFKILDNNSVNLNFQAKSENPEVASGYIKDNSINVQPLSKGNTIISLTANDGYGRNLTTDFKVIVLGQNLEWPEDNRLLLLYQSGDVFYLYSKLERRIWYVRSDDIQSMVYYGLSEVF